MMCRLLALIIPLPGHILGSPGAFLKSRCQNDLEGMTSSKVLGGERNNPELKFFEEFFLPQARLLFRHYIMSMENSSKGHFNNLMGFTIVFGNSVCLLNADKMKDWKIKNCWT